METCGNLELDLFNAERAAPREVMEVREVTCFLFDQITRNVAGERIFSALVANFPR